MKQRSAARDYAKIKIEGHADMYEYKRLYAAERRKTPAYKAWQKEYNKNYREKNKEKLAAQNKTYQQQPAAKLRKNEKTRAANAALKEDVFLHYGGGVIQCAGCGFTDIRALDLDHVNNDGAEHRRTISGNRTQAGASTYRWVKNNNYPEGFQVLCRNCNWIKEMERRAAAVETAGGFNDQRAATQKSRRNPTGWVATQIKGE